MSVYIWRYNSMKSVVFRIKSTSGMTKNYKAKPSEISCHTSAIN